MSTRSNVYTVEVFDLISCTTINGSLYGIIFVLYCLCAWPLCLKLGKPDNRRQVVFSLGYISLIFLCATGELATNSRGAQLVYINHANFPGGPYAYEQSDDPLYAVTGCTFDLTLESLTMAIQLWHLWIVWSGTRYAVVIIILPVLLLLSYLAMDTLDNIVPRSITVGRLGFSHKTIMTIFSTTFATLSSFTIVVTGLIAVRILLVRRRHMQIMSGMSEAPSPYLSIIAILVESYILDSAWSLASTISLAIYNPSSYMFVVNDSMIKVIAYFLVVYRVETGRGWTKQTEEELTSLQWNHSTTASDCYLGCSLSVGERMEAEDSTGNLKGVCTDGGMNV